MCIKVFSPSFSEHALAEHEGDVSFFVLFLAAVRELKYWGDGGSETTHDALSWTWLLPIAHNLCLVRVAPAAMDRCLRAFIPWLYEFGCRLWVVDRQPPPHPGSFPNPNQEKLVDVGS